MPNKKVEKGLEKVDTAVEKVKVGHGRFCRIQQAYDRPTT